MKDELRLAHELTFGRELSLRDVKTPHQSASQTASPQGEASDPCLPLEGKVPKRERRRMRWMNWLRRELTALPS